MDEQQLQEQEVTPEETPLEETAQEPEFDLESIIREFSDDPVTPPAEEEEPQPEEDTQPEEETQTQAVPVTDETIRLAWQACQKGKGE